MSREELIEALTLKLFPEAFKAEPPNAGPNRAANSARFRDIRRKEVSDAFTAVLNPLLERVAGVVEPFARIEGMVARGGVADAGAVSVNLPVPDLRQAASLHTELKGLLP